MITKTSVPYCHIRQTCVDYYNRWTCVKRKCIGKVKLNVQLQGIVETKK
jgi:hypothetical protein